MSSGKRRMRPVRPGNHRGGSPLSGDKTPKGWGRGLRFGAAGILLLALMAAGVLWLQPRGAALPELALDHLDPKLAARVAERVNAVRAERQSGAAWGRLGAVLKSLDFKLQAEECLNEAARLAPEEPRWPYHLAMLRPREAPDDAVAQLRKAVALCGNEPEMPRLRLARMLAESGQIDAARGELRTLIEQKPDCSPARMLMAQLCHGQEEWDQAFEWASGCTGNAYTAQAALTLLATLHQRRGETEAAQQAIRRAESLTRDVAWPDPFEEETLDWRGDARSLSDRAQSLLLAGRPDQALPLAQRLAREYPDFAESWLVLGRAQYLLKKPGEAEGSLRRYLEMDWGSVNGWFQLGMSLMAMQRYSEAAETFLHATTLKRGFGPAYFNRGFALAKSGQLQAALEPFREAIRHNPEMIDAYILLADLYVQLGDHAEADALEKLATKIRPEDPRLPHLRAKIVVAQ